MSEIRERILDSKLGALLVLTIKSVRVSTLGMVLKMFECCETFLDLGCGEDSPMGKVGRFTFSVGVDISVKSLRKNKSKRCLTDYVCADLRCLPFRNCSFDCVLMFDVIEHFLKKDGFCLMEQAEKISKKILLIQTPNGYCPTPYARNVYDSHKSSWFMGDFENAGFIVLGRHGYKRMRRLRGEPVFRPRLIGEIVLALSQLVLFNRPSYCFHLLAFKKKPQMSI